MADIHASTPTLAAHFAVPDLADELLKIENYKERLKNFISKKSHFYLIFLITQKNNPFAKKFD